MRNRILLPVPMSFTCLLFFFPPWFRDLHRWNNHRLPSRELTYPIMGKRKSSAQKSDVKTGICLFPGEYSNSLYIMQKLPLTARLLLLLLWTLPNQTRRTGAAVRLYTARPAQPSTLIPHETLNKRCLCNNYEVWHLTFHWFDKCSQDSSIIYIYYI